MSSIKQGKMPNVTLFLMMAVAFVLIGMVIFEKHIDFEDLDTPSVVAMSLSLVFGIMFVSALIYHIDFLKPRKPKVSKKAQLNTN